MQGRAAPPAAAPAAMPTPTWRGPLRPPPRPPTRPTVGGVGFDSAGASGTPFPPPPSSSSLLSSSSSPFTSPRPLNVYDLPSPTPEEAAAEAAAVARTLAAEQLGSPEAQAARAAERALAERAYHPVARAPQPELRLREERPRKVNLVCVWPRCATVDIPGGARFKRCSACKAVYCSRSCQTEDWPRHRPECKAHRAAQRAKDYGERALVLFVEALPEEAEAEPAPAESPAELAARLAAEAERARVEALPTRALKAELAARGVSVVGLSERRVLVEALLGAPPPVIEPEPAAAAPVVAAASAAPAAAVAGQEPANIEKEDAAASAWSSGPLAANLAAAERGDAAAQCAMGARYEMSVFGVPQEFAWAARWYRKSADQGFACAQIALADAYFHGRGVPQSDSDAVKWHELAAAQNCTGAQVSRGRAYKHGIGGLDIDLDEARRLYMLAAATGHPEAPNELRRLGFSPSGALVCRTCFALPSAGTELQRCSGCKEAHYCGAACQRPDWGPRPKDECRKWKAAQAAQRAAMEAQGVARQKWLARPLAELLKAANEGDATALAMLGLYYFEGAKGLTKSLKFSAESWTKAVIQGDAFSQYNLGVLRLGDEVARSEAESVRLFRLAAKQGDAAAMFNLAKVLCDGTGCEKDPVLAMLWMTGG